jgi:hypothetical protein
MQHQGQTEWCWSAVAICVAQLMGNPGQWTQCSLATAQLNPTNGGCCPDGSNPTECNVTTQLEACLGLVQHLRTPTNASPNPTEGVPDPSIIMQEIDNNRPIGVRIAWDESGDQGHFVLVTGYDNSTSDFAVWINDPENPEGAPPFQYSLVALQNSGYQSSSGKTGSWSFSYFTA